MPLNYGQSTTIVPAIETQKIVATEIKIEIPRYLNDKYELGALIADTNGIEPGGAGYIETREPDIKVHTALDPVEPKMDARRISVLFFDESGRQARAECSLSELVDAGLDVASIEASLRAAVYSDVFITKAGLPTGGSVVTEYAWDS